MPLPSHMIPNEFGVWCAGCGELLDLEDVAFGDCATCGGDGFADEDFPALPLPADRRKR